MARNMTQSEHFHFIHSMSRDEFQAYVAQEQRAHQRRELRRKIAYTLLCVALGVCILIQVLAVIAKIYFYSQGVK